MQPLSTRTDSFTDSVIRRMTRISNRYGAVNLSQGFPDFDPPAPLLAELTPGPFFVSATPGRKVGTCALVR